MGDFFRDSISGWKKSDQKTCWVIAESLRAGNRCFVSSNLSEQNIYGRTQWGKMEGNIFSEVWDRKRCQKRSFA